MPKKRKPQAGHQKRIDASEYGIDLGAILRDEIFPLLADWSHEEIADEVDLSPAVVRLLRGGHKSPSLAMVAAIGSIVGVVVVEFKQH